MHVLKSDEEDGVATLTISIDGEDHRFDIWEEGGMAYIAYQETLSWRGSVEASDPDDSVYLELMTSEEVTEFLDEWDCYTVKRASQSPTGSEP